MPVMPDEFVGTVTDRYVELFEKITGDRLIKADTNRIQTRVESNIMSWIQDNLS